MIPYAPTPIFPKILRIIILKTIITIPEESSVTNDENPNTTIDLTCCIYNFVFIK